MIEIDGSYGEGGGQLLRTAVALSTFTDKPVRLKNIRANRPNPGMKPQHYTAVKILKEVCNAKTKNLDIDSDKLEFLPGKFKGGNFSFDVGTAGSITLIFQACILGFLNTKETINIKLKGGTDVKWSPSWDYFKHVYLPLIKKFGVKVDVRLIRRGYYPKGGGEAELIVKPNKRLKPYKLNFNENYSLVQGNINIANLPEHISKRIKHSAIKKLIKNNIQTKIDIEETSSFSPGVCLTLWTKNKNTVLGSSVLGEKGVPSEEIGEKTAEKLVSEIKSGATLDIYAFDQLVPFMALTGKYEESTCFIRDISNHAKTNIWLVTQFLDIDYKEKQKQGKIQVLFR